METKTNYPDEIVSAGQLLRILDTDANEVSSLCQKACLRPKKDGFGNVYFSKGDVDVLRKVKELYEQTKKIQEERRSFSEKSSVERKRFQGKKIEKIQPVRFEFEDRKKETEAPQVSENEEKLLPAENVSAKQVQTMQVAMNEALVNKIDAVENNVISKLTDILSEKLDGLDEVIVELIKAKTENETLRQKVNDLNKENFALKTENSSFKSVGLGLYVKKTSTDNFTF